MKLVWIGRSAGPSYANNNIFPYGNGVDAFSPSGNNFWRLSNYEVSVSDEPDASGAYKIEDGSTYGARLLREKGYKVYLEPEISKTGVLLQNEGIVDNTLSLSKWSGLVALEDDSDHGKKFVFSKSGDDRESPFVFYDTVHKQYRMVSNSDVLEPCEWHNYFTYT